MLSHREHARIVEAIIARDADAAAKAMFEHLTRSHLAYGRLNPPQAKPDGTALPPRARPRAPGTA